MNTDDTNTDLLQQRADALFTQDARGRMVKVNEPDGGPAPDFYLGRSTDGVFCRFGDTLADDIAEQLVQLISQEPPALTKLPLQHQAYGDLLQAHDVWSGPAYAFPSEETHENSVIPIVRANARLLQGDLEDWRDAVNFNCPLVAVIEDGYAVSVCASVRITKHVHEAGVETLPAFRHQGFAARAVAGWANLVCQTGARPIYSTSWGNIASQAVAASLGLTLIGVDYHISKPRIE